MEHKGNANVSRVAYIFLALVTLSLLAAQMSQSSGSSSPESQSRALRLLTPSENEKEREKERRIISIDEARSQKEEDVDRHTSKQKDVAEKPVTTAGRTEAEEPKKNAGPQDQVDNNETSSGDSDDIKSDIKVGADNKEDTNLEDVVKPSHLPPFYFVYASCWIKPIVTVAVFGPPRIDVTHSSQNNMKGLVKVGLQLLLLASLLCQTYLDMKKIGQCWAASDTWFEGICFSASEVAASGNITTLITAMANYVVLQGNVSEWKISHLRDDDPDYKDRCREMEPDNQIGCVGLVYSYTSLFFGGFLVVVLSLFTLPAMIAYCWITLLIFMVYGLLLSPFQHLFPRLLVCIHGSRSGHELVTLQKADNLEDKKRHLSEKPLSLDISELSDDECESKYEENWDSFIQTGVPEDLWGTYISFTALFTPMIALMTPLAARFYTGGGYMPSLTLTLGERHLASYIASLKSSFDAKFDCLNLLF